MCPLSPLKTHTREFIIKLYEICQILILLKTIELKQLVGKTSKCKTNAFTSPGNELGEEGVATVKGTMEALDKLDQLGSLR